MADIGRLTARDLYIISGDGEPRMRDVRLGGRLDYGRPERIRDLGKSWHEELLDYGPIPQRTVLVRRAQGGGRETIENWYNEGQCILLCFRSDAPNARTIRKEIIEAFLAFRRGERPATPLTDALLASPTPKVERTDNVLRVTHEDWTQPELFSDPLGPPTHPGEPIEYDAATDTWYDPPKQNNFRRRTHHPSGVELDARGLPKTPPWSRGTRDVSLPHFKALVEGEPLTKLRAHHLHKSGGRSFACQCFVTKDGRLAEFRISQEPIRRAAMHERWVLRGTSDEILVQFDWSVVGAIAAELLSLERECEKTPLSERQAEAVLTLLCT